MRIFKYLIVISIVGILAYWFAPASSPAGIETPEVTYLCRETGKVVRLPAQSVPAVNPQTGRATLYRALYCEKCKAWQPVPGPDVFPGNPLRYSCPKHDRPMAQEGPLGDD